jgi:hypothetical protein
MPTVRKLSQAEKQQAQDEAQAQNTSGSGPTPSQDASLTQRFPTLSEWLGSGGWLEIGYEYNTGSFIRIIGGENLLWQGERAYPSLDAALEDAERNLKLLERAGEL